MNGCSKDCGKDCGKACVLYRINNKLNSRHSAHCFYSIATFSLLKMLETIILLYSRKVWQGQSLVNLANCS